MDANKKVFLTLGILIALIAIFYFVSMAITKYTGFSITGNVVKEMDDFAKCLSEKGIKMYGSAGCPHCAEQKKLFGNSFQYIDYIECRDNPDLCVDLIGVPAWGINGQIYYGVQSLEKLAELSGCSLNEK